MFERAMAASSGGVSPVGVYGAYAKFLWSTGGDRAKVVELFEKACAGAANADATCAADSAAAADVMASYASFLLAGGGAMTARGEQLLRASLTLQPRNATTLTRYAHFLIDFMGDTANAGSIIFTPYFSSETRRNLIQGGCSKLPSWLTPTMPLLQLHTRLSVSRAKETPPLL